MFNSVIETSPPKDQTVMSMKERFSKAKKSKETNVVLPSPKSFKQVIEEKKKLQDVGQKDMDDLTRTKSAIAAPVTSKIDFPFSDSESSDAEENLLKSL